MPRSCSRARRDHPRTRGVYRRRGKEERVWAGSSPRARGLPRQNVRAAGVLRIIPACAGLTGGGRPSRGRCADHPRMRGVYASRYDSDGKRRGSSPHARGLLGEAAGHPLGDGIIPACAGFTWTRPPSTPSTPDHPRMRGVYTIRAAQRHYDTGSSPHARGLRRILINSYVKRRIIPARAGFTVMMTSGGGMSPDHPRTRGVYGWAPQGAQTGDGSSPHTRGLHEVIDNIFRHTRIIPAHAGFTLGRACGLRESWDHPRTRGVYCRKGNRKAQRSWIIPAHAGFTGPRTLTCSPTRDHPRTRGVYRRNHVWHCSLSGSSPHARGLPEAREGPSPPARIIPARAGFT